MSKKIVRVQNYFSRRWFAAIASSCVAFSVQTADAAHEGRQSFKEFRANNPDVQRSAARKMFHQQVRVNGNGISAVPGIDHVIRVNGDGTAVCGGPLRRMEKPLRMPIDNVQLSNNSVQVQNDSVVRLNSGVNLDLSSADRNITLGEKLFDNVGSVAINVGGEKRTVEAGSQVSAAEYVAVKQALAGGQLITVDGAGRANGGRVDLSSITGAGDRMRASNLVVPQNVTTYGDFSRSSEFRLTGDLDNYGSVVAVASDRGTRGGTIHADDITNHESGLISTSAPRDLAKDLGAHANKLDLNLAADGDLTNLGTISSSGSVTLTAGSGSIRNAGTVSSASGDVNLNGSADAAMNVDNTGGQIVAERGAISIRNEGYQGSYNTTVTGGDLLSKTIDTNAGNGSMDISVGQLTGELNQTGTAAHVEAATNVLNLGNICLTGDPTYRNTAGSIALNGDITVGEALTIVATGDITVGNGVDLVAAVNAQGFPITLIAGADITNTVGGIDSTTLPPLPATTTSLTLSGNASSTGGSILFGTNTTVSTRSLMAGNTNGGDLLLAAFSNSAFSGTGTISAASATIQTGGRGTGTNGNVSMIAGATNGTALVIGSVNTSGGTGSGGAVLGVTAQPVSTGGNITYDGTGSLVSAASLTSSVTLTPTANLAVNSISSPSLIILRAGNQLGDSNGGVINASSGLAILSAGGNMTLNGSVVGNSVSLNSGNNLTINGSAAVQTNVAAGFITSTVTNTMNVAGTVISGGNNTANVGSLIMSGAGTIGSTGANVTVNSTGSIIGGTTTLISAPTGTVTLNSSNGNVGANAGLRLRIDSNLLSSTAFNGSIYVADLNTLNISGATANSKIDITAGDTLSTSGLVSADIVNLQSIGDAIVMNANITAGTSANLKANTDIIGTAPARLTASQVFLSTQSADIGGGGFALPFLVDADNIVINTVNGGALVSDSNSLNFGGGNSFAKNTIIAIAGDVISNTSTITANNVNLASISGSVNIASTINGAVGVVLQSSASITNANVSGTINTPLLTVASTTGDIGVSALAPFITGVSGIVAAALTGDVFVSATNPNVRLASGISTGIFSFTAAGTVDITGTVNGNTGVVTITAPGGMTTSTGTVNAASVNLISSGNIGVDLATRFTVNTQQLSASTTGDGIFINDTSATAVTVAAANSAETVAITATLSNLVSGVTFNQDNIFLTTGGVFNLTGDLINDLTSGVVVLTSGGTLTNAQITGTIQTNALGLASTNGGVGTATATPFVIASGTANITRINSFGDSFVRSDSANGIALTDSTTDSLEFVSVGNLTIIGDITANTDALTLQSNSGTLRLSSGVIILGFDSINLLNTGTSKKNDKIIIESGVDIFTNAKTAGLGDVNIVLGALSPNVSNKIPKNVAVVETGGTVEFRGKSLRASGPVNTITAMGANVVISNSLNAKNLTLGGDVEITADPPVAAGTPSLFSFGRTSPAQGPAFSLDAPTATTVTSSVAPSTSVTLFPADFTSAVGSQSGSMAFRSVIPVSAAGTTVDDDSYIVGQAPSSLTINGAIYSHVAEDATATRSDAVGSNGVAHRAIDSDCLTLTEANGLFVPNRDTTIVTHNGSIKVAAGSAVFVSIDANQLSVYNLYDNHKSSVSITAAGRSLSLAPGQHCTLTQARVKEFRDVNPIESVQHRGVTRMTLDGNRTAFTSEFSLPSAMNAMSPVKTLVKSQHKDMKRLANSMMKTTAVIMHLNSTPYEFHAKPRKLALMK